MIFLSLLLSFLLLIRRVSAAPYNVTLNSTSPLISYSPSRTGPVAQTWNVSYTESNWPAWTNQTIGQGSSYHYTTHTGATASISWYGVSAYLYGSAANGAASITIDGGTTGVSSRPGVLGFVQGLSLGWHHLNLTVANSGGVNVTGAKLTFDLAGPNASFRNNTPIEALWGGNNINAALDTSKGTWEPATLTGGGGGSPQLTYNHIDTHTPNSLLTLQPPSNTSLVMLLGLTNFDHGPYSVTLHRPDGSLAGGLAPAIQSFSGYSPWIGMDEVLYIGVLNPAITYRVTVQFLGLQSEYWDLGRVLFITADTHGSGGSGSSSTNIGAIVGGVVGGIAAIAIAVGLLGYFCFGWCRKRKEPMKSETIEGSPFEIDRYEETTQVSPNDYGPYSEDPHTAYAQAASGSHPPFTPNHRHSSTQITPLLFNDYSERRGSDYSNPYETPEPHSTYDPTLRGSSDEKRAYGSGPSSNTPPNASINGRPMSNLTVANVDLGEAQVGGYQQLSQNSDKSRRRSGPVNPSRRPEEFTLERDAGRFVMPTEHGGTVPPSYDPAWRSERVRLAEDGYGDEEEDDDGDERGAEVSQRSRDNREL